MDNNFFAFQDWRDFLKERFRYLKATKPKFSARFFARQAGIGSPSYFELVVSGRRNLSPEYADRFANGLDLDGYQTQCLVTSVALESCTQPKRRDALCRKLDQLRRQAHKAEKIAPSHVAVLADPINLKIYLLAQSRKFKPTVAWLRPHLPDAESDHRIGARIALLLDSGLWVREDGGIRTIAPTVGTGDHLEGPALRQMHENLLAAAKRALVEQPARRRILGSRTFLFDPERLGQVQQRINTFKQELESEFEALGSTAVYQLHVSFFELEPQR